MLISVPSFSKHHSKVDFHNDNLSCSCQILLWQRHMRLSWRQSALYVSALGKLKIAIFIKERERERANEPGEKKKSFSSSTRLCDVHTMLVYSQCNNIFFFLHCVTLSNFFCNCFQKLCTYNLTKSLLLAVIPATA